MTIKSIMHRFGPAMTGAVMLCTASAANATLMVNITDAGGGATLWQFSGSSVAASLRTFDNDVTVSFAAVWTDIPVNLTNINDLDAVVSSGVATVTINQDSRTIDSVYIDDDGDVAQADEFGIGVSGTSLFPFASGDTVSWTGSVTVNSISIGDFLTTGFSTSEFGTVDGALDLTVVIGQPLQVSEPGTLAILGLGFVGLGFARRKRIA